METVYISVNRSSAVTTKKVHFKDIGSVYCRNRDISKQIEELELFEFQQKLYDRKVVTVLKIMEWIQKEVGEVSILNLGDSECIIYHKPQEHKGEIRELIKVAGVCCVTFFGAAFTIMTYNNDVGVNDIFEYIYTLFIGKECTGFNPAALGYAIGMPIGMIVFFNHIAHKRFSQELTPLEVQMRLYERDANDALAIGASRKGDSIDVD